MGICNKICKPAKVLKNPLKVIAAAAFMVALGYGISMNPEFSEFGKTK